MSAKEKKSASELRTIVIHQVRQCLDLNDIINVAIYRPAESGNHSPNWDAAFTTNGQGVPPEPAFHFVRQLQSQFECDWL
jgi:hypothetical protein